MVGLGFDMPERFARSERQIKRYVRCQRDDLWALVTHPANMESGWHLKAWRKARGLSQEALAEKAGTSKGYLSDLESGKRPIPPGRLVDRIAAALEIQPADLFRSPDDAAAGERLVPIIGRVGADTEGTIIFAAADETDELVPIPPGGTETARGLKVVGHSMGEWAPDGSLIYIEDQRNPPTPDLLGYVCAVETEDGRVLIKRLLRGSEQGRYDLESRIGPTIENVRLRWAAEVTAVVPPRQARRIIRSASERQVA
jgi:transcriptional regulator with XRE-family HTH domain